MMRATGTACILLSLRLHVAWFSAQCLNPGPGSRSATMDAMGCDSASPDRSRLSALRPPYSDSDSLDEDDDEEEEEEEREETSVVLSRLCFFDLLLSLLALLFLSLLDLLLECFLLSFLFFLDFFSCLCFFFFFFFLSSSESVDSSSESSSSSSSSSSNESSCPSLSSSVSLSGGGGGLDGSLNASFFLADLPEAAAEAARAEAAAAGGSELDLRDEAAGEEEGSSFVRGLNS